MSDVLPKPASLQKSILVVDDDQATCLFFKSLLMVDGFEVETVFDGKEALELFKKNPGRRFDLVILDLMMPGSGGYEVLKELDRPPYPRTPVFIVTAFTLDKALIAMIKNEPNVLGFWTKPIDNREFKASVHEILGTAPPERK